ncbi:MAG: efflux RND transporter permease subunit [Candidatus Margulisbacteria bacterium]|nr:efflux RND transporter permease subunit [Candidatus Margulisiibacteriota bacterium]
MQPTIYKLNQAIRTAKRMINDNVPGGRKCLAQALEAKYALEMGHANPPPPITPVAVPAENTILPARFYELVDELRQGQIIWTSATIPTVRNRINREFLEILLPLAKTQENTPLIKFDERQESFLTVSLTPTLDLKYCSKTQTATLHAGGKALNHMRACQILGIEHAVVGFGSTARTGQILSQLCQIGGKLPTNVHLTEIDDDLRIVTILDDEIWKAPGPKITNKQLKEIADKIRVKVKPLKEDSLFTVLNVIEDAGGPPVGKPVDVTFIGDNDEIRMKLADNFYNHIKAQDGIIDIIRSDEKGLNELNVKLNHRLMSELGITAADVASVIRTAISGTVATSIRKEGEEIDFRVMLEEKYRNNPEYIKNLTIPNRMGKLISLGSFISFDEKSSAMAIWHREGDRSIRISADVEKEKLNVNEYNQKLKAKYEPLVAEHSGFRMEFGGEERTTDESMNDFFNAFSIAILVIYIILVILFNSFTEPVIVMLAIPFGLVGVIFAFALHGETVSFMGLIGILGLSGVVVNNSLVMLKFLNKKEEDICKTGETLTLEHVADAAMLRFRPITLTTVTTVAGLIPSLYGFLGGRIDFLFPLLLALTWGLIFSTFITLFLIPCFYLVERNVGIWASKRFGKFKRCEN